MAIRDRRERHQQILDGPVHHTDRDSQYTAIRYTDRLAQAGAVASIGSAGDSYDNALAESTIGQIKTELIHHHGPWRGIDQLEFAPFEYLDWWNHRRLHSEIGHIPPAEKETHHVARQATARMVPCRSRAVSGSGTPSSRNDEARSPGSGERAGQIGSGVPVEGGAAMAQKTIPASGGGPRRAALTSPLADSPGLHVSSTYDGIDRMAVQVDGEVDVGTVDQLRTVLDRAIETGVRQLVIDLRGVSFLGSDGLDCLARASCSAEAVGCHLYTVASHRVVVRPFEITGLGRALRLCDQPAAVPSPSTDD